MRLVSPIGSKIDFSGDPIFQSAARFFVIILKLILIPILKSKFAKKKIPWHQKNFIFEGRILWTIIYLNSRVPDSLGVKKELKINTENVMVLDICGWFLPQRQTSAYNYFGNNFANQTFRANTRSLLWDEIYFLFEFWSKTLRPSKSAQQKTELKFLF